MLYLSKFLTMRNSLRSFLFATALLSIVGITSTTQAGGNDCEVIILNPGQCVCHNSSDTISETCPSESGVTHGHDCHLAEYCCFPEPPIPTPEFCNFPTLNCALIGQGGVQDTFGKCNGCGNGLIDIKAGCCDPDTDTSCTDPAIFCEECDDGANTLGTHNCDENCQIENCGNGLIEEFEDCDGSALGACGACDDNCKCCSDADDDNLCDVCSEDLDCAYDTSDTCFQAVACISGNCVITPVVCNDSNFCTADTCDHQNGCVYTPSMNSIPCYSGPEGSDGVGVCRSGIRNCSDGSISGCIGEILPTDEVCGDNLDNDCDGGLDEDCPNNELPPPQPENPDENTDNNPSEKPNESAGVHSVVSIGGCSLIR